MKNLQRLQGIDGDYDNDSGSGPDRVARRRTIQNLEKARQPRRQIGTLDVAFKKRFLKLTAQNDENNAGTPILTRRMTMRAETIRALEVRKNSVMAERRKSQMQTLGANNEYGVTTNVRILKALKLFELNLKFNFSQNVLNNNHQVPTRPVRSSNAGINIKEIFNTNGGHQIYGTSGAVNQGYEHVEEDDGNSIRLTPRNQVSWSNNQTNNQRL